MWKLVRFKSHTTLSSSKRPITKISSPIFRVNLRLFIIPEQRWLFSNTRTVSIASNSCFPSTLSYSPFLSKLRNSLSLMGSIDPQLTSPEVRGVLTNTGMTGGERLEALDDLMRRQTRNACRVYKQWRDHLLLRDLKAKDVNQNLENETEGYSCPKMEKLRQKVDKFDLKNIPNANILVLGETGVGKSTFINGLVNYLNYESMDDSLEGGVHVLIKSSFILTDDDYMPREISTEATAKERQTGLLKNTVKGQSATQEPKSYTFTYGEGSGSKTIRIIDTPGIGDTRGIDQDKKNFEKILSFISGYPELHAILILIKPNSSRLTLAFRFCIDELLVHLHKSAAQNIIFCFTNTRGTLYKPGDTLPTLREHLNKLEESRNIRIPLNKQTLFSFDNESFRFLCAKKQGFPFSPTDEENFNASWTKSVEETQRLFTRIAELPEHRVEETLCLNNTRNLVVSLARPLAEIARNLMINMDLIEDKLKEVEECAAEGRNLKGKLYVEQIVINAKEIPYPMTVCTAAKCVEHRKFSPNAPTMQTIYKTVCHAHCHLTGVQVENCPNTAIQHCAAFGGNINCCQTCQCNWTTHMHIRYQLEERMEKMVDPDVEKSIRNKDDKMVVINLFLEKERRKVAELREEHELITQYCAEFAAFLSRNSILPYNDSYREYVKHLIREEKDKVACGGSDKLLKQLEQYKDQYEEQVRLIDMGMKNGANVTAVSVKNPSEIQRMVHKLLTLRHCGNTIEELKNLELHSIRAAVDECGVSVRLPDQRKRGIMKFAAEAYHATAAFLRYAF